MDLYNVGLGSFYRVKDYVSAASNIGQNYCAFLGGVGVGVVAADFHHMI
jgi:hypothetical protein